MSPQPYYRKRRNLADRLKALREEAGRTGTELAQQLGWAQSKVSRIENAKQVPTESDIRGWAKVVQASPEIMEELFSLLGGARTEYANFREQFRLAGGPAGLQAEVLAFEMQATRIALFQPAMIPGLLQTGEYAREMLRLPAGPLFHGATEEEIARMVALRMQRQQVLYQPGKQIQVVLFEGALRCRLCTPVTLLGQLDRLLALIGLPTVELGIVPFVTQVPVYPLSGFDIYDDNLAIVETVIGESRFSDPREVSEYLRLHELLRGVAGFGDDAAEVIRQVMGELRQELQASGERSP